MTPRPRKIEPRRAIGYVRVSSQQQAESGLSLEHQDAKVRAAALLHDMTLVNVITDAAESAASLERPGVARVLEMVRRRQVDAVIITKLDRLTRSVRDLANLLDLFKRHHVALVSVQESLDTSSAAGRLVINVMASVGQWEREAIAERTSAALSAKRTRGERAGAVPYGYSLSAKRATDKSGKEIKQTALEPNEAERQTLRLMVECRDARYSLREIADELNRQGRRTRAGQPWRFEYVRSALKTLERQPELLLTELRA